ncbi:MAG: uncharacterized protein A8A55_2738 [Amphiamblys sp. WSBS2006]|nr:MAG: uncharacterized protein A8A55_2738 [Amphiamblys sp. WSBS2006]
MTANPDARKSRDSAARKIKRIFSAQGKTRTFPMLFETAFVFIENAEHVGSYPSSVAIFEKCLCEIEGECIKDPSAKERVPDGFVSRLLSYAVGESTSGDMKELCIMVAANVVQGSKKNKIAFYKWLFGSLLKERTLFSVVSQIKNQVLQSHFLRLVCSVKPTSDAAFFSRLFPDHPEIAERLGQLIPTEFEEKINFVLRAINSEAGNGLFSIQAREVHLTHRERQKAECWIYFTPKKTMLSVDEKLFVFEFSQIVEWGVRKSGAVFVKTIAHGAVFLIEAVLCGSEMADMALLLEQRIPRAKMSVARSNLLVDSKNTKKDFVFEEEVCEGRPRRVFPVCGPFPSACASCFGGMRQDT